MLFKFKDLKKKLERNYLEAWLKKKKVFFKFYNKRFCEIKA